MDRPDEDPKPRGSVGRDVEQGAVGAAEEHAGGHDPAQKLKAPPGPDAHGVPPRRSTPALCWLDGANTVLDPWGQRAHAVLTTDDVLQFPISCPLPISKKHGAS